MKKVSKQDILTGIKLMGADERAELEEGCKELLATVNGLVNTIDEGVELEGGGKVLAAVDGPVNIITDNPLVGTVQFFVSNGKLMVSAGEALYEMTSFPH